MRAVPQKEGCSFGPYSIFFGPFAGKLDKTKGPLTQKFANGFDFKAKKPQPFLGHIE
jgi:hypothetical protein